MDPPLNHVPAPASAFLDLLLDRVGAARPPQEAQRPSEQPETTVRFDSTTGRASVPPSSSMPMPHLLQHQEARNDGEPRMDVMCSPHEYKFAIDLPGVSVDTLDVRVQNRTICVSGSRPALVVQPPSFVCMSERPAPSRFRRNVLVHADADLSQGIEAHFRDGLLCLSVKRSSATASHRGGATRVWNSSGGQTPVRNYVS